MVLAPKSACNAFDEYLELSRCLSLADDLIPFEEHAFLSSGQYRGVQALEWWRTQRNVSQTHWLDQLSGVAAMMLLLPVSRMTSLCFLTRVALSPRDVQVFHMSAWSK